LPKSLRWNIKYNTIYIGGADMSYIEEISKLLKPVKDKYNKNKRFKNYIINFDDYKFLLLKKEKGLDLSQYCRHFLSNKL